MPDIRVEPIFNYEIRRVNPAIDIVEGKAAVGVWLPCKVTEIKRDGKIDERIDFYPFYITEDHKLMPLHELPPGYALGSKPIQTESRWRVEDIKRFIGGIEPPSPADVFFSVLDSWAEFMEFKNLGEYIFRTLWDIGTYFAHIFRTYPYDYLGGVKGTGKTKALMLHSAMCFNAILSGNMSTATLYRLIQNARSTLLIDETEKLAGRGVDKERVLDFRNILLFGYKKGSCVYRVEKVGKGERLIPQQFEVYGPKGLANIQGLEDVLADRCKITIMPRARGEVGKREIKLEDPRWAELRDKLYRFYLAYWRDVKRVYGELSERSEVVNYFQTHREYELWLPIWALAKFFDNLVNIESVYCEHSEFQHIKGIMKQFTNAPSSLCSLVRELAKENAEIKHAEEMTETGEFILMQILLTDVNEDRFYKVKILCDRMAAQFDEPQDWLTTRWVGNALRRLGFTKKRRVGTGYEYWITPKDVETTATRLGVEKPEPTISDLKARLVDRFGFDNPFTPKQYADLFTDEEAARLPALFDDMLGRGELVETPRGLMLVRRPP